MSPYLILCFHIIALKTQSQHVCTLEKPQKNLCRRGLVSAPHFDCVRGQTGSVHRARQEVFGEPLQCAAERRVCRTGVGDPHHGQTTSPGERGGARCGVCRRPDRHRDLQPTWSEVLLLSAAAARGGGGSQLITHCVVRIDTVRAVRRESKQYTVHKIF